tara:strand:+ start:1948 stop:3609 length:1662 start_codon:yes stop_codon:yes gene_type:complete
MNEKKEHIKFDENDNFYYNIEDKNLKISFNRISFIFFIFFILAIIFSTKVIYLGSLKKNFKTKSISESDFRSTILDREGNILAKSVLTTNIGINPNLIINKKKLLIRLQMLFPKVNYNQVRKKINGNKFFYFAKRVNKERYDKILLIGDKSIITEEKITRIYPHGSLFSHILGQIDDDNNGISGIEKKFDLNLKTSKEPLTLTLDTELQYLIRKQLINFKEIFDYIGGAAILMNVNNGEILSMVSLPDFDLNTRQAIKDKIYINRATKGVYELGSVFKTFTFAAGLNEGIITPNTKFEKLEKKIRCGKHTIGEYDEKIPTDLTAEEILIRSGNIGSVRIGQKLGIEKLKNFLLNIGVLDQIEFDLEEVGKPIPFNWGKCKLATTSFGHGITTTPLQLAKGYSIISNGGFNIIPTLIKKKNYKIEKRILKEEVSNQINPILRKIVSTKEGTAGFANIPGYEIGGKTGTAEKNSVGGYTNKKVNTFTAVFPTSKPKFVLLVLLDEPKPNKEYTYYFKDGSGWKYKGNWRNTAGWTSVEIAGKIIENIGPILATKY